jgi:hypothetical protein
MVLERGEAQSEVELVEGAVAHSADPELAAVGAACHEDRVVAALVVDEQAGERAGGELGE